MGPPTWFHVSGSWLRCPGDLHLKVGLAWKRARNWVQENRELAVGHGQLGRLNGVLRPQSRERSPPHANLPHHAMPRNRSIQAPPRSASDRQVPQTNPPLKWAVFDRTFAITWRSKRWRLWWPCWEPPIRCWPWCLTGGASWGCCATRARRAARSRASSKPGFGQLSNHIAKRQKLVIGGGLGEIEINMEGCAPLTVRRARRRGHDDDAHVCAAFAGAKK